MHSDVITPQFNKNCCILNPDIFNINSTSLIDKDSIIEKINYLFELVGLFSSKVIGKDQFDEIIYSEDDDDLLSSIIKGSNTIQIYSPYNDIFHHKNTSWKMNCLNIKFNVTHNIILYHDFPNIFNIKRSDGNIQKAMKKINDGLIIRKNVIYLRTHFNNNLYSEIKDSNSELESFKDISIQDLIEVNKNIKHINLIFEEFNENDILTFDNIKSEVMKYYNNLLKNWIQKQLDPCIISLKDIVLINYKIKQFS